MEGAFAIQAHGAVHKRESIIKEAEVYIAVTELDFWQQ